MGADQTDDIEKEAKKLWGRLRRGDHDALGKLFRRYFDSLYGYGFRIIPNSDRIRDAIQEVFFQLWKYRNNLGEVKSVRAYLFVSLKRELLNDKAAQIRREKLDREYISEEFDAFINYEKWMDILELQQEEMQRVKQVIAELTPRQREAIYLKFYEGLTNTELSKIMGVRAQSVYNLVYDAIQNIRTHLNN